MSDGLPATEHRPLPRGPHNLSREEVVASQRERLLDAMVLAVAEKGYAKTVVADVLTRAGVSRATFYQLFDDKEDCFQAAYERITRQAADLMSVALDMVRSEGSGTSPVDLVDRLIGTYLDLLASSPALTRTLLVEVYAAGPKAIEQRRRSIERFVDIIVEIQRLQPGFLGANDEEARFAAEVFAGALSSMVTNLVGAGEMERLPELRVPFVRFAQQLAGRR